MTDTPISPESDQGADREGREYIRITPSRSELAPEAVVRHLAGLHGLDARSDGLIDKLRPFGDDPPVFEFLALTEGADEPVEFYYGADRRLDALEERLRTLYPPTVTFERVGFDLERKLIPPVEQPADDRTTWSESGNASDDDAPSSEHSAQRESHETDSAHSANAAAPEHRGDGGRPSRAQPAETPTESGADPADAEPLAEGEPPAWAEPADDPVPSTSVRPSLDEVDPLGITWYGQESRREDWMTTLVQFTDTEASDTAQTRAPLASLIDQLTRARHPMGFQVLFQHKPDWTHQARERQRKLREGEDRLIDRLLKELFGRPGDAPQSPSETGRQRQYLDIEGQERVEAIDEKEPQHTFTVNMRLLSLATDDTDRALIERRLDNIRTVFDHLQGANYRLRPKRVRRGLLKGRRARSHAERFLNRTIVTKRGWRKTRPNLVLGPAELASFIVVPPATELTMEGGRGSQAEPETRTPPKLPNQRLLEAYTDQGMAIGHGIGEDRQTTTAPIRLPPRLLPYHTGRFAKSGGGKSIALTNDGISVTAETSGPVFIIDSKGGAFPINYMRAHAKRFGVEDLEENVLHFDMPEILPGFAFYNIASTYGDDVRRVDAIQDKADHFEELIKMVMGPEKYESAITAPPLLKYLIKAMYDEEYGLENGDFREDVDYFTHSQLEDAVSQFQTAGPPNPSPDQAPRSSKPRIQEKLQRHLQSTPSTFAEVISGLNHRLNYISQDANLWRIFNTTDQQFDFQELLDEDMVVIFDLGNLRDNAARIMTGLILTELYDTVKRRDIETLASKPDDYVINVMIDEASSVVVSDTLTKLLEKGREFRLSIELAMQFPEQMKEAGNREVYLNVLNNIGNTLVGNIAVDDNIATALAHEAMDPVEVRNRLSSLPRGELLAWLTGPGFGETGPEPFSLKPLAIPPGHPESDTPLTAEEERRFAEALDTVHARTRSEYGVSDQTPGQRQDVAADVDFEHIDDEMSLEVALARTIRAVQISEDVRASNGWVSVDAVDAELLERIDESDIESRGYATLPDVRKASSLIEVALDEDRSTVQCRLTAEGEDVAEPETSSSPTGGGDRHDTTLGEIEQALSGLGFSVQILDQDSSERPDAIATHPEIDVPLQVEAETTTHVRPAKILANLRKAQDSGRVPLFVVDGTAATPSTKLANRIAAILQDPHNQLQSGETRLYTTNENVTFNGGARVKNGVTALRPATDTSRHTRWFLCEGSLVLADGTGEEHARLADIENASKDQFPATYSYDPETETYTVYRPGEPPDTYDSRAAFESDWVPVKHPFVPATDLPTPDYTDDSYAIAIVTDRSGDATVRLYDPTEETTEDLATLVDALQQGELRPAVTEPETRSGSESDTHPETRAVDTFGLETFTRERVIERDEAIVAVAELYEAYEDFAAAAGYEVKPKNRFTRALREHVDFERDKRWVDGKTRRCYVGIELQDTDSTASPSDAPG